MDPQFYSLAMILEHSKIGYCDEDRTALLVGLAQENNQ